MLDVIDEEKLQENCANVGTYFLNELAKLRDEFEIVGDVRGKGLMVGVELVEDKVSIQKQKHFSDKEDVNFNVFVFLHNYKRLENKDSTKT